MLRSTFILGAVACGLTSLLAPAASAFQPSQPAGVSSTGPSIEALKITVTGIEGIVQVRTAEDQPWKRATVGMELDQNAEFRTAPRSAVRFTIPPDQTVTLDRLGTVKVIEAISDNGKLKTKLGMKYGRTRYDIESAGQEHESSISSPSSTLAVRGTIVSLYDQRPFVSEAVSLTGRAEFQDAKKRVAFGGKGAGKTVVNTNNPGAPELALGNAVVDPTISRARSEAEANLVAALLSHGATVDYDFEKGIKVIRGGKPLTDTQLVPALPGVLNFVLRWTGNADLNLGVISPGTGKENRTVYPVGGLNVVKSGGEIAFDHRGGPNGGMEIVSWPAGFPEGVYRVGAVHISGVNTPATLDTFLNGKRVDILTGAGAVQTAHFIGAPINPLFGAGIAIGEVRLFPSQGQVGTSASAVKVVSKK